MRGKAADEEGRGAPRMWCSGSNQATNRSPSLGRPAAEAHEGLHLVDVAPHRLRHARRARCTSGSEAIVEQVRARRARGARAAGRAARSARGSRWQITLLGQVAEGGRHAIERLSAPGGSRRYRTARARPRSRQSTSSGAAPAAMQPPRAASRNCSKIRRAGRCAASCIDSGEQGELLAAGAAARAGRAGPRSGVSAGGRQRRRTARSFAARRASRRKIVEPQRHGAAAAAGCARRSALPSPGTRSSSSAVRPVDVDREPRAVAQRPGELRIDLQVEHAAVGSATISSAAKP